MAYSQFTSSMTQAPLDAADGNSLWARVQGEDALETMSRIIPNIAGIQISGRDKLTVPSPWSSIISFDLLLDTKSDYGEIKSVTENEWKTLLTLVALRKIRSVPMMLETISLKNNTESFAKNVEEQFPKNTFFRDAEKAWENVTLIKLNGEVAGVITPSNLVCSRYYYDEEVTPQIVSWLTENNLMTRVIQDGVVSYHIQNPMDYIFDRGQAPNREAFTYMRAWLLKIEEFLKTPDDNGGFVFKDTQNLITRISDFRNEIETHANALGWVAGDLVLKASIPANQLTNGLEMIESIQGEYSWIGLLTAIAYEQISDYKIEYVNHTVTMANYKSLFHPSIINDPTACAVLLDRQCIGVVRNNQLVSLPTATGNIKKLVKCGLMTEGAEYNNPVDFAAESYSRFAFIKSWMQEILKQIPRIDGINIPEDVTREIGDFISKLNTKFTNMPDDFKEAVTNAQNGFTFSYDTPPSDICELFKNMTIDFNIQNAGLAGNVTIMGTNYLLFSEKTITGELLSFYNKSQNQQNTNVTISNGYTVFDTDNVFESILYYIEIAKEDVQRLNNDTSKWFEKNNSAIPKKYTVLWPIKEQILDIFKDNIDILLNGLNIRYDSANDLCFIELDLPTQQNQTGGNIIYKSYGGPKKAGDITHKIIDSVLLPGVSIWPFAEAGEGQTPWENYTLYESRETNLQPGVANPYMVEYMPKEFNDQGNEVNVSQDLELSSNVGQFKRRIINRKTIPRYITIKNGSDYCGAVLFKKPSVILMDGAIEAKVALDFGTSSTAVYANLGMSNIPVKFGSDEVFTPIKHEYNDEGQFFIPNADISNNYYPSLIRQSSAMMIGKPFPFSNGNIIYKYEFSISPNTDGDMSLIKDDLKWGDSTQKEYNMKAYLRQIVLRTLMFLKRNGCSNVEWYASYPSAYSAFQKNSYESALTDIIRDMHKSVNGGLIFNNDPEQLIPPPHPFELKTESVAAAKHCMSAAVENGVPYVAVIDIGGGSTDMSVWKSVAGGAAQIIFQSSVEMASRGIFLKPLIELIKTDANIQRTIAEFGAPFNKITEFIEQQADSELTTLVEQLLQLHAEELKSAIHAACNMEIKTKFERKVVTGFYALVFYAMKSYIKVIGDDATAASMQIHLTGNGSKLYNWITDIYKRNIIQELSNMLNGCRIQIIPPGIDAKTEAAQGMLAMAGKAGSSVRIVPSAVGKVGSQGRYLLCGADITIEYYLDGQYKTEDVKSSANMTDPESTISKGFAGAPGYEINNIVLTNPAELSDTLVSEFINTLTGNVFDGALKVNIDYKIMNDSVMTDMGSSLESGRIMSPLFLQVKYVIEQI